MEHTTTADGYTFSRRTFVHTGRMASFPAGTTGESIRVTARGGKYLGTAGSMAGEARLWADVSGLPETVYALHDLDGPAFAVYAFGSEAPGRTPLVTVLPDRYLS